jgi:hypothetical protein
LTVTLPSTNALPGGWSMGFATDNNKDLTVQVNGTSGGRIVWPGSGASQASLSMANTSQGSYEFLVLQYDGNGIFRVVDASPATAQAIGIRQQPVALHGDNAPFDDSAAHGLDGWDRDGR